MKYIPAFAHNWPFYRSEGQISTVVSSTELSSSYFPSFKGRYYFSVSLRITRSPNLRFTRT